MPSLNKWAGMGHAGRDPELRIAGNGNAICNITMACSESWTDKNSGEKREKTEWMNLVFYKRLAEIAAEYLVKGSLFYVEGPIRTEKYEKDGVERYITKVEVRELKILTRADKGSKPQQQVERAPEPAIDPDDLPF